MTSSKTPVAPTFPAPIYAETVLNHLFTDGQQFFLEHLLHIHYAHCLMLAKQRILTRDEARAILRGLDTLDRVKIKQARYDGTVEDLYFYVERELITIIGADLAGKLHTARSRNDIDITLYRMKLRGDLLDTDSRKGTSCSPVVRQSRLILAHPRRSTPTAGRPRCSGSIRGESDHTKGVRP